MYGITDEKMRYITAALYNDDLNMEWEDTPNMKRVMRVLTEEQWNYLTPARDPSYDGYLSAYDAFVSTIKNYPAFCGEKGEHGHAATLSIDDVCRKELATLFAHFAKESGANEAGMTVPAGYPGEG